ncbi:MAG: hypothetical protein ACO36I_09090 [Candidatus Latescibacterota bacterium]
MNISHSKKEICEKILREVGKDLSIFNRIRLGGKKSQNFVIVEASNNLKRLLLQDNQTNSCKIELREYGIILHFRNRSSTYVWVIPYYLLSIFKNDKHVSLFAEGEFVRLMPENSASLNYRFLKKLQKQKSKQYNLLECYTNEERYTRSH